MIEQRTEFTRRIGGCLSVKAVCAEQMLQLLDGSEDSPLPGGKQANGLTHEKCPRNALGASHKNARETVTV
ncbi:hypothetical protein, partial [Mycobacterium gordonae]|uniref:hypothetical protein n=1 Tax=Mycobacterium gordonae TaxID=1778 RepID=UPI001E3097FF